MNLPQLQRDVREVENELRLARNRLQHYEILDEHALANDARRVVEGHQKLIATLTSHIQVCTNGRNSQTDSPAQALERGPGEPGALSPAGAGATGA